MSDYSECILHYTILYIYRTANNGHYKNIHTQNHSSGRLQIISPSLQTPTRRRPLAKVLTPFPCILPSLKSPS